MILSGKYNHDALHKIGAQLVSYDESKNETTVSPDVDMLLYDPSPSIVLPYEQALDNMLDSVANAHRYNDRFTFAIRAAYPGPWQVEGMAFAQWMDTCNAQAYQMLLDVQDGKIPQPTVEEFLDSLPKFEL